MLRAIIVDDEEEILEELKQMVSDYTDMEIAGIYMNPHKALEEARDMKPDCAFLDIEMPGMNGIVLAERLLEENPEMEIIFITAFNQYATQAFDINALDYILKPIRADRFLKSIERIGRRKKVPLDQLTSKIEIRSLGDFSVLVGGEPVKWSRSKSKELFAYLLHMEGAKVDKYKICDQLWPEFDFRNALINLQTAMCALRKSLGAATRKDIRIEFADDNYRLKLGNVNWDLRFFENQYEEFLKKGNPEIGIAAVSIYKGTYMGNQDWEWSRLIAGNLDMKYIKLVSDLSTYFYKAGHYSEGYELVSGLMQKHPLSEDMQFVLLDSVYHLEGIAGLKTQYGKLKRLFLDEYDLNLTGRIQTYFTKIVGSNDWSDSKFDMK